MIHRRSVDAAGIRRPAQWAGVLVLLAGVAWPALPAARAQEDSATNGVKALELLKVPDTIEALRVLREGPPSENGEGGLIGQIRALQPATRPAAEPTTQPAGDDAVQQAANGLLASLQALVAEIDQHIAVRTELSRLRSSEAIEAFTKELAELQRQMKEVEARLADPPRFVTDDEMQEAQREYDRQNEALNARIAMQTQRTETLMAARNERQQRTNAVQEAQVKFQSLAAQLQADLSAAESEADRVRLGYAQRQAQIDASLPLFRQVRFELGYERDTLVQGQEERRIPLQREYTRRLGDLTNRLRQIRSQSERERIEAELAYIANHPDRPRPVYEKVYWELRLEHVKAREAFEEMEHPIRTRFPDSAAGELKQDVAGDRAYWKLFVESLDRRPSEQVRERYRQLHAAVLQWQQKLDTLQHQLDETVDEQRGLFSLVDEYVETIRAKADEFTRQLNVHMETRPDDPGAEKLRQEYLQSRKASMERAQATFAEIGQLITRLQDATVMLDEFVRDLEAYRSQLYWHYRFVAQRPLWQYEFGRTRDEFFSDAAREDRMQRIGQLREAAGSLSRKQKFGVVAAILIALVLALWARRALTLHGDAMVARWQQPSSADDGQGAPISDRFHLQAARYAARTVLVVLPALACIGLAFVYPVTGLARNVVLALLCLIVGLALFEGLASVLFLTGKPRWRLLQCSNVVARHYRRWAMVAWFATLVLVPAPLLLWAAGTASYSEGYLWSVYKIVLLGILLLFGLRRQTVLRVVGRPEQLEHRAVFLLVSATYPLLWIGVAGLLVMEVAGYAALTSYVIRATGLTIATMIVALLASRYVSDLGRRYRRARASRWKQSADAAEAETREGLSSDMGLRLATGLFAWVMGIGAILLICRWWGITAVEIRSLLAFEVLPGDEVTGRSPIVVGRLLMAIFAIMVAWWASRVMRSVLSTQIFPAYAGIDRGAQAAISTIAHYVIILLGLYFALFAVRVPLGALTVLLGTIGLGVGLGLQPLIVNFVSGLMILFERHLRVGDVVEVDGKLGEVISINMRSTSIKTYDNIDLVIPNSDFITKSVTNWTFDGTRVRGRVEVGVAYGTDTELVTQLLLAIARRSPLVLAVPEPTVWFTSFGSSSLDFVLVAWFRNTSERWTFMTTVRHEIGKVFAEHRIEIPFPQQTLSTVKGAPLPVRLVPEPEPPAPSAELPATEVEPPVPEADPDE
ncbi:MAG: mechanosensitive ion channel [Phycisphaerae bacterium]|nr:mechanosensitive ion channel [Phycisphaerae bacterium]